MIELARAEAEKNAKDAEQAEKAGRRRGRKR